MSSSDRNAAFAHFRAGRLAQAEAACRAIVARDATDAEALHLLGFILATSGRREEGLPLIDRSIEAAPRNAAFLDNRAQVLMQAGRDADARRDLERATREDPRSLAAWLHFSQLLRRMGEGEGARAAVGKALAIDPEHPAARYHDGLLRLESGDLAGAEASLRRVLAREPHNVPALNNLGVVLRETARAEEALVCFQRGAAADPANPDVLNNLGLALHNDGQSRDAIRLFKRALQLRPGFSHALLNWGNALRDAGELAGGLERYREAAAADPALAEAQVNLASVLLESERLAEARAAFEGLARIRPDSAEARAGLAQVQLREHQFAEGWENYERRFNTRPPTAIARELGPPRLVPANLAQARRVAVWMEQGVGDQILFSTLLPELVRRGIAPVVEADPRLVGLFRRGLGNVNFVTPDAFAAAVAGCDHQVPLGSLPRLFRPDTASFAAQPPAILKADPDRVATYRAQLGNRPAIAIAWRSLHKGSKRALGERKSIPLEAFARLGAAGAQLVDLQYGDVADERRAFEAAHPGMLTQLDGLDAFSDLEGVAAALIACGRLVCSSNVTAHLAGALGVATDLLYLRGWAPFSYWVAGPAGHSPWYRSVRLPQDRWKSWDEAFEAAATVPWINGGRQE